MAYWLVHYRAWCEQCEWTAESRNAQGIAAQHATKI